MNEHTQSPARLTGFPPFSLSRALLALVVASVYLLYERMVWPNGSTILFGPFWCVVYDGPWWLVSCAVLLLAMLSFPAKPHLLTAILALFGFIAWLVLGLLGRATGC